MVEAWFYEAAGNRFAIVERGASVERALDELVRPRGLDGLLVFGPGEAGADCRMEIVNRDGSRPEACGNGLRCIARFAFERGAGPRMTIATDAGPRAAHVRCDEEGRVRAVRTTMGVPRVLAVDAELEGVARPAAIVDLGNPHCVFSVDDVSRAPVSELGPLVEHHARFPERTNVGFAERRADHVALRVWERGVGVTAACGTGAAAAAAVLFHRRLAEPPLEVRLSGGVLTVFRGERGELELEGPVASFSPTADLPIA